MKNLIYVLILFLILLISGKLYGQYIPLKTQYKIENSTLIVEGKVTAQRSYVDENNEIFTENIIDISKIHKGEFVEQKLSIITFGGTFEERSQVWSHVLNLNLNEYGVFLLAPSSRPKP